MPALQSMELWILELEYGQRVMPYEWAFGADTRAYTIVAAASADGTTGWGEGGIYLQEDPLVLHPELLSMWLDHAADAVLGRNVVEYRAIGSTLLQQVLPSKTAAEQPGGLWPSPRSEASIWQPAAVAVETAVWDLYARCAGTPMWALLGPVRRPSVEWAPGIGCWSVERAERIAESLVAEGFRTLKVKGGRSPQADAQLMRRLRAVAGDGVALRLDPNGAYSLPQARELASATMDVGLEYLEQPLGSDAGLREAAKLRAAVSVPIALDESVATPASVLEISEEAAADVLLLEMHQLGGFANLLVAAAVAEACHMPLSMHAAYSTGIRTAQVLHVVAALQPFVYAPDTLYHDLRTDVLADPLPITDGATIVPQGPGIGVDIDLSRVDRQARYRARADAD